MTETAAALAASLEAVHGPNDTLALNLASGAYFDWSTADDTGRTIEIGENINNPGAPVVQLTLTHDELLALHAKLTLTLMRDAQ
jgi:hypothetical protein